MFSKTMTKRLVKVIGVSLVWLVLFGLWACPMIYLANTWVKRHDYRRQPAVY
ncbi:hypothetical protein [Streptococcus mutans]|uniref:Uncharacterized protein n=2 Tax=Streptococcus mutans TaxID=1309 RepID=A0A829BUP2_STRMG|nr:hypothetical protein [Streptococcus mutans]EMB56119.1 hypothetical protein SMU9_00847 [Streptococcus mutans 1ID3]EMB57329.1 hypothetical protein SMU88_01820 [Streptococcus mutans NLML8]EMB63440.1 hypothetical protein SMU22_09017 [Streptococcus mutans 4SM1]EMB74648.1 hypothetical protein SMU40_03500 [Streptococcus mutans 15VF2]EMB86130.1 hypothetical protein SMU56_07883 [Streptococcus mutans N29]EMB97328.1 hypothetical protein SMU62_03855 [Streptococcus mutans M21]EMC19172.1 hypothetical p